ncbi:MAG: TonB-dependent receptor [Microscillaceae bacterium]|nr:TonB-dependent receptor [Microscillaceae bacterium]
MKASIFLFLSSAWLLFSGNAGGQSLTGQVKDAESQLPLVGASLVWFGTKTGTVSDAEGRFSLQRLPGLTQLIISYVGYRKDTLTIAPNETTLRIALHQEGELQTILVRSDKDLDTQPIQSELLTTQDLRKAACCNLSESFETQATVDATTTDAVSGTRRIRMLGLDGVYALMMTESRPGIRGLSARSGLQYIPGHWIKSIDINKGSGSVVNGYESVTGQLNLELAKPENSEPFSLNLYANMAGRLEANINTAQRLSGRWSTATLLHASHLSRTNDQNEDNFRDIPEYSLFTALHRWKYQGKNMEAQFGASLLYEDKLSGQNDFERNTPFSAAHPFGYNARAQRGEGFGKIGFLSQKNPAQSLGLAFNIVHHQQETEWGLSRYEASQRSLWLNVIFQTEFSPRHGLRTGASFQGEIYDETYRAQIESNSSLQRRREEAVPGAFAEYTFQPNESLALVAGLRADYHNLYGPFVSPRWHVKYAFSKTSILRLSAGQGLRVANPLAENQSYLLSARQLFWANDLQPERAWNYGASFSQRFLVNYRPFQWVVDFYRTDFQNQVVVDLDSSPQALLFYNLEGRSYANSFQISADYELAKRLELSLAYKWYDVRATFGGRLQAQPFVPQHRFFANLAYTTPREHWSFDATVQWIGPQRLPNTQGKPEAWQLPGQSPDYVLVHAQVTYRYKQWEFYLGGENLANVMQKNPVLAPDAPFGPDFDAGLVYAPVMGAMLYTGLRFTLPRK